MDGGLLSNVLLTFKAIAEHQARDLTFLLEPSWFILAKLMFVLLVLGLVAGSRDLKGVFLLGLLWLGFTHVVFLYGYDWADSFSHGIRRLSDHLGVPAYDPSAIAQLGMYAAAPLFKGTGDGGFFSFLNSLAGIPFLLAGLFVLAAFATLAFVQFALLLMNYILLAGAPFFLLWLAVPGFNALTQIWTGMFFGCMSGLFVTGLLSGVMVETSRFMADRYELVFNNAGYTPTWVDFAEPVVVGFILAAALAFIPWRFSIAAWALGNSLLAGVGTVLSMGGATVAGLGGAVGSATGQRGGSSGVSAGSGQQQQIGGAGSSGGSSGMGPASMPSGSAWGKRAEKIR